MESQEKESQTSYIQIVQKPLTQEWNSWTVLTEMKSSAIFWVRKGLSGNSTFQGHRGGKGSKMFNRAYKVKSV